MNVQNVEMQIINTNIYSRFVQSSHFIKCFIRGIKFITPATFAKYDFICFRIAIHGNK